MNSVIEAAEPAGTVARKCRMEEALTASLIELISMAPKNSCVRGLILSQTGKMPPPEMETPDQIREWVEINCDKRMIKPSERRSGNPGISISVDFSETEYGRADYSVRRYGKEEFIVNAEELVDMVQEIIQSGEGIEGLVDDIAEKIDEDAWNQCDPSMEEYDDYDYSDHESNTTDDSEVEFSKDEIRDRVTRFLRERHPDLLNQL